ncbi:MULTISPECIES: CPBP family intramembrane glutamic endopeptidase [Lactobacillus]|uniref:CPBP family intramembrane glutamic endopeptidase n=1 Tax=Lactobacillus TaxID=1578 RepID=UPI000CD8F71C|nr:MULTISPECIES: CPBP family intramembrane glutamic endopeptidase [Lactobacillus]RVU76691.1 CPBP family intramembrane metalloprotease [Lactobacillus xujianguonis]
MPIALLIFGMLLVIAALIFNGFKYEQPWWLTIKEYVNAFIPIALILALKILFHFVLKNTSFPKPISITIYSILALTLFLPFLKVSLVPLRKFIPKLLAVFILSICVLNLLVTSYHFKNEILFAINDSSIINAFLFLGFALYLGNKWWQTAKMNLYFSGAFKSQWLFLLILLVFIIWSSVFSALINLTSQFKDAIWNWTATFSILNKFPGLNLILAAIEAGILEETLRWLNLRIVLSKFRHHRGRIELAVLISALIFAVSHSVNYFSGQTAALTAVQIFITLGFCLFLAAVYLYTGQFWLIVLIHACQDWLVFRIKVNPLADMSASGWWLSIDPHQFLPSLLVVLVYGAFTIVLLTGKRRSVIKAHLEKMS